MTITHSWTEYEAFCKYITYLEGKKYKTQQEKDVEPYLRAIAKRVHDSIMSQHYGGGVSGAIG